MLDPVTSPPSQTLSDQTDEGKKEVSLLMRVALGIFASGATSFILTWASLAGIDFTTFGISSEVIKSSITGTLTGVFVAPECIPLGIAAFILYFRKAFRIVSNAATRTIPADEKE